MRSGKIDERRRRQVADDYADRGPASRADPGLYRLQDRVGIDVDERSFRTKRDYAPQFLFLGMPRTVRVEVGAWNAAEEGNMRARCAN